MTTISLAEPLLPRRDYLVGNSRTESKIKLNFRRNKEQDQTEAIDAAVLAFDFEQCRGQQWNQDKFSLLYGTRLWEEASTAQRLVLNQLYWVAYYSQIISAEIATIYFNQTSAAGLYAIDDFRVICDGLDLESAQERAHINAFKSISEKIEQSLFGERIFTYPMRGPFVDTMIFSNGNRAKSFWRNIQLRGFGILSAGNAFIASQYFLVRGLRTLNGKLVQHQLSKYYQEMTDKEHAPIPAQISFYHFLDESFHFNSSTIISHDVARCLPKPTLFERMIINKAIRGCQRDHGTFSTAINGLFWYDPALYMPVYRVLRSGAFGLDHHEALEIMRSSFTEDSEGVEQSAVSQQLAIASYKAYLADLEFIDEDNKQLAHMRRYDRSQHLALNRREFSQFAQKLSVR